MPFVDKPAGPDPSDPPAAFYVSVINGSRRGLLAGPYPTHALALAAVPKVTAMALDADRWAWHYRFGTAGGPLGLPTIFGLVLPSDVDYCAADAALTA